MNGFAFWATDGYAEQVETARQTPPPDGEIYLDSCDGRPTDRVGTPDSGCLADYPGEFSQGVILGLSVTLFLVVNLTYLTLLTWRSGRRRREPEC